MGIKSTSSIATEITSTAAAISSKVSLAMGTLPPPCGDSEGNRLFAAYILPCRGSIGKHLFVHYH